MFSSSQYFDLEETQISLLKLWGIFGSEQAGDPCCSAVTCLSPLGPVFTGSRVLFRDPGA